MISYQEQLYWHHNSYGRATRIPAGILKKLFVLFCIVTPATNWLIPFTNKIITQDLVFRHA